VLRGQGGRGALRHDQVGLQAEAFAGQDGKLVNLAIRGQIVNDEALALHVAEVVQAAQSRVIAAQSRNDGGFRNGIGCQKAQPGDFRRLLCLGERHGKEGDGECNAQLELAQHHDVSSVREHYATNRLLLPSFLTVYSL
jgi:hypothetical protein